MTAAAGASVASSITVSPGTLPAAHDHAHYKTVYAASGGTAPYTFGVAAGRLPLGVTLTSVGVLRGTPTVGGNYYFTLRVKDSAGHQAERKYTLTVKVSLYIIGHDNGLLVKVSSSGVASTITTTGLIQPNGVGIDPHGNVFISDTGNDRVVKITPEGTQTVFATGFNSAARLCVDSKGNVYVADIGNNRVVKITPDGTQSVVSTGALTLSGPISVDVDRSDNLYISDTHHNRIVKVTPGGVVSAISTGSLILNQPSGTAIDRSGDLYIDDYGNGRIVEVPVSGSPSVPVWGLVNPNSIGIDPFGNLYLSEHDLDYVLKVLPGGTETAIISAASGPVAVAFG